MKILIIGGNGFIGTNLCRTLLEKNEEVYSFDIQLPAVSIYGVRYIVGDFFDNDSLLDAIRVMDVIVHSLSTVNPGNSNKRYMQGYSRDFVQSVFLFDQCRQNAQKVIFISSGGTVYGEQEEQPIKETALGVPINHYGSLKLCIETAMRTFNKQVKSQMVIARVANPYGPGQDFHKGVGFVDAALKKAMRGETIEIWGDGSIVRDYIYITDACEMIYSLIHYEGNEEVFNVSSGVGISQNDVIKVLERLGLQPNVVYQNARSVDLPKIILDNTRISEISHCKPISFENGLQKFYQCLKETEIS